MMNCDNYKTIPTSPEVWAVIKAKHHKDLVVFSSFSNPNGDFNGNLTGIGEMFTAYGFKDADYPLMEVKTTWKIDIENNYLRNNEKHEYWLCLPLVATI